MLGWWKRQQARDWLHDVSSALGDVPPEQGLAELDLVDTRSLLPRDIALWLNNRAYLLALVGSTDEALEHLQDAEEILAADLEDGRTSDRDRAMLACCIVGTRGIALLHAGSIERAEAELLKALEMGRALPQCDDPHLAYGDRSLTAERLW